MGDLSKKLGGFVLFICLVLFIYQLYLNARQGIANTPEVLADQISWLVSLAVAAIPFNFPLITTIILLTGVIALAKRNAIIKKLTVVETLGRLSVICSDKTGTLTKNEMTVQKIFFNLTEYNVTGVGYDAQGEIKDKQGEVIKIAQPEFELMIHSAVENNNTQLVDEIIKLKSKKMSKRKVIGLPTEAALLVLAEKCGYSTKAIRDEYVDVKELLFTSERKRMSKFVRTKDNRLLLFTKGAPEAILNLCSSVYQNGSISQLTEDLKNTISQKVEEFAAKGLRTLAMTYRNSSENELNNDPAQIERNLTLLGIVGILDPPREGVKEAIKSCHSANIKVVMVTGDHGSTARSIAQSLGIWKPGDSVIEGAKISTLDANEIEKTTVFARVAPEDKQYIVDKLQSKNKVVAMTGDGINDAIALERADAGIAMGIAGTDVAKNAADIILTDDSFATIERAVYHGRGIFNNIRSNIAFLLSVNIMELFVLTYAALILEVRFFLGLQLIIFYISIHFFPPIALMFDKYDRKIMSYPPKPHDSPILDKKFILMILIQVLVVGTFLLIQFVYVKGGGVPLNDANLTNFVFGESDGFYINDKMVMMSEVIASGEIYELKARSMCMLSLFVAELIIAWGSRSDRQSIFKMPISPFLVVISVFLIGIIAVVFTLPVSHIFLAITGLSTKDALIAVAFGLPVFFVIEFYKLINNKLSKRN